MGMDPMSAVAGQGAQLSGAAIHTDEKLADAPVEANARNETKAADITHPPPAAKDGGSPSAPSAPAGGGGGGGSGAGLATLAGAVTGSAGR